MNATSEMDGRINALLAGTAPFVLEPAERLERLLALFKDEIAYACQRSPQYQNYVEQWPFDYRNATRLADLPYLPVGVFKMNPPLKLVEQSQVTHTLASSATTGQVPSRVVLDSATARRMSRGVTTIVRDFIGPSRRPYLVIDVAANLAGGGELGARGAAIQGLRSFATETVCCLEKDSSDEPNLNLNLVLEFAAKWKDAEVLVYGFTYVIWNHFVKPLQTQGVKLEMPNVRVLHSGGWKRLERQSVSKDVFNRGVASVFGTSANRVTDFYGMIENVGVIYPDCEFGNKHVPAFAEVLVRDPLTLEPVAAGEQGLVQVCSVLPTSFPGFLLLTEDIAEVIHADGCPCGRRGTSFRFVRRAPKAETRGCGNVETVRERPLKEAVINA
jgi:phenylacetate-coenzyme A ligase PaaK-like adenylate-forming protein